MKIKCRQKELYKTIVNSLSAMSTDTRLKVGGILLKEGRIISTGYNGQLPGQPHEKIMIDGHDQSTVHCEMNIISFCAKKGISTSECELIVSHSPCQLCTKLLIQSGISKVYYLNEYRIDENPFIKLLYTEKW